MERGLDLRMEGRIDLHMEGGLDCVILELHGGGTWNAGLLSNCFQTG